MNKKTSVSSAGSLEGFDWKTFIVGFKKPFLMLVSAGIVVIAKYPEVAPIVAVLGGVASIAERVWAIIEFYVKEVELK